MAFAFMSVAGGARVSGAFASRCFSATRTRVAPTLPPSVFIAKHSTQAPWTGVCFHHNTLPIHKLST